jgi:hypothetical protein
LQAFIKKLSMRQPTKKPSRVPAYQNGIKSAGTAILCVKSLPWRGLRDLGIRLKPSLAERVGYVEKNTSEGG